MKLFQSTLPRRERPETVGYTQSMVSFQSTLPRRERPDRLRRLPVTYSGFNPRSHAGSDIDAYDAAQSDTAFQSTLPRRERHNTAVSTARSMGFNPRSHAGSDAEQYRRCCWIARVSIHAPTQGATTKRQSDLYVHGSFNPRSHAGSDAVTELKNLSNIVSIHAPTQGATISHRDSSVSIHAPTQGATSGMRSRRFNPRSHAGSDHQPGLQDFYLIRFQSTLPRRERRIS